ncbi:beta-N-acetylhexosaminidase [Paenibacillus nanensis]|uniref:Beta-N-acetylhexosaminidase n=1 Tax=Paenibacillus nanensis TaxID=393251 RepID=A0A3A1UV08_9BACL|nr:beta-N-acetylhexosaminidase [Paenibacillus nanensis]RIX52379.1 beta-N-acetylhexosaminidase [Paenibacillus nanensis]
MKIHVTGITENQRQALSEAARCLRVSLSAEGLPLRFERGNSGIIVQYDGQTAVVSCEGGSQFVRAFGLVVEGIRKGKPFSIHETPWYSSLGVMIDCSRNAVLHMDAFQSIVHRLALMGYTHIQLYTEDTYEMESYPYFGYMRGRYTTEQWKSMDRYAAMFGIELVPCIQTLAHLGPALKWAAHADLVDCNDILLIDEPKTYELIEEMFRTMAGNLSSRSINIGMDEAHMMGLGKYLDKHGYHDRSALMMKHFTKVMEIARSYGYKPMMWSDMFFRLASGGEYYDPDSPIRADIAAMIPEDLKLVYWDYYTEDRAKYDGMMKKHKQLSDNIVFAGGAWKWMGFTPNNAFSRHIGIMAHESCIESGIRETLVTAWGDNGAECSFYAVLPTLQLWAELCYKNTGDESVLRERFATCASGEYEDFISLDLANLVPDNPSPGRSMGNQVNPSKYLLYQDVLYGLFDKHVLPEAYKEHYYRSAALLKAAAGRNPEWSVLFETQAALCSLLELKAVAGIEIREAYRSGNKEELAIYVEMLLPELKARTERFMNVYKKQWMQENKIFGLDVFDLRMGGLLQRIETAMARISQYLGGGVSHLEELEEPILTFDAREESETKVISAALWHAIATPSVLAGI